MASLTHEPSAGDVLHFSLGVREPQVKEFDLLVLHHLEHVTNGLRSICHCYSPVFTQCLRHDACGLIAGKVCEYCSNCVRPVSPVRMRMASSIVEMKILPSPMRPVLAAFWIASRPCQHIVGQHDLDLHLGQEVDDVFGTR
jgi:hypothetical protein